MTFTIKTQTFEGPLDLLLTLIEERKLYISDVSLSKVTDDFIAHIRQFENMPMDESAHFILIASTLLLIKSKSLLPELTLTEEEQVDIRSLETRLAIYKRIKEASLKVSAMFGQEMIFGQSQAKPITPIFSPDPQFTLEKSLALLHELINRLPKKENLPQVTVRKIMSLEEMIGNLTSRITSHLRMSFKEFTKEHKENRVNVIVSFLAMLELVKQGVLQVSQEANFGDILMETKEVGVPKY
ncbi:MAG: segregation/condensation protein A [Candidatus Paceibacterota bacterium]|jgi:segregation and condensation protein A